MDRLWTGTRPNWRSLIRRRASLGMDLFTLEICCVVRMRCVVLGFNMLSVVLFGIVCSMCPPVCLVGQGVSRCGLEVGESNSVFLRILHVRDDRFEEVPGLGWL